MALGNNPTPNELVKEVRNIGSTYLTEQDLSDVVTYDSVSSTLEPTLLSSYYTKTQTDTLLAEKQSTLVSGTNIKTINNESLLGSGNITISGGGSSGIPVINIEAEVITAGETSLINLPISNADWALLEDGVFAQFKVDLSQVYGSLSTIDIVYITNNLDIENFDAYMILNAMSNLSASTIGGMYLVSDFKNFGAAAQWNFCGTISTTESDGHVYKSLLITSQNIENFTPTNVQVDSTSITSGGVANLQTKNSDYNAATNKLVTENDIPDVSTKLDKVSIANKIYGTDGNGSQTTYGIGTSAGNIPKYDANSRLQSATPSGNTDVANKGYVDISISNVVTHDDTVTTVGETTFADNYYTKTQIVDLIYPIGSVFITVNNVNPSTYLPNTNWELIEDRFLLGAGSTYTAGATGGNENHTHSLDNGYAQITYTWQDSQNRLGFNRKSVSEWSMTRYTRTSGAGYEDGSKTSYDGAQLAGSTDSSSNMPPYLVVYMWKRIPLANS